MAQGSFEQDAAFRFDREHLFWRFSIQFYGRAGMQDVLLTAQDRYASDVNMLLFALWQAGNGLEVSSAEFSALNETIANWRDTILLPMRALRRSIKETGEAVRDSYKQAKALELSCERIQQSMMYETARHLAGREVTGDIAEQLSVKNLNSYVKSTSSTLPESDIVLLAKEMRAFVGGA